MSTILNLRVDRALATALYASLNFHFKAKSWVNTREICKDRDIWFSIGSTYPYEDMAGSYRYLDLDRLQSDYGKHANEVATNDNIKNIFFKQKLLMIKRSMRRFLEI